MNDKHSLSITKRCVECHTSFCFYLHNRSIPSQLFFTVMIHHSFKINSLQFGFKQAVCVAFSLVNHVHLIGFCIAEYEEAVA